MTKQEIIHKRRRLILPGLLFVLAAAFVIYAADYYRVQPEALAALESDEVRVEQTDYGWFFDGPAEDAALIFYPGGKVEETAYAPFLHRLAAEGMDVCLVKMPLRLAVLRQNAADAILARYDYERWFIGGHSLGGAVAALYAAEHGGELEGVILFAAYPTKALDSGQTELLLYGSEDLILKREALEKGRQFAPPRCVEIEIPGGNHAQFGNYGAQQGDGTASIDAQSQQEACVEAICRTFLTQDAAA